MAHKSQHIAMDHCCGPAQLLTEKKQSWLKRRFSVDNERENSQRHLEGSRLNMASRMNGVMKQGSLSRGGGQESAQGLRGPGDGAVKMAEVIKDSEKLGE